MWFKKKQPLLPPPTKIEVFVRHCIFSDISWHKERPPGFSREKCHANLLQTADPTLANLTWLLDIAKGPRSTHFLPPHLFPLIEISEGTEAGSFLRLLDHVLGLSLHPETIVYFVEDDYLHRGGWVDVLLEGFQIPSVDYVTLYDHRDKYFLPMYHTLQSRLFLTPSTHWRSTPSTTHTFATKVKTLLRDEKIHRKYSTGRKISADHDKFCALGKKGRLLVSPIPGWSTHAEVAYASPFQEWKVFF